MLKLKYLTLKIIGARKSLDMKHLKTIIFQVHIQEVKSLNDQTNIFMSRLDKICHKVFKLIKVTNKREKEHESLYNKWNLLRNKSDKKSNKDCIEVEN